MCGRRSTSRRGTYAAGRTPLHHVFGRGCHATAVVRHTVLSILETHVAEHRPRRFGIAGVALEEEVAALIKKLLLIMDIKLCLMNIF